VPGRQHQLRRRSKSCRPAPPTSMVRPGGTETDSPSVTLDAGTPLSHHRQREPKVNGSGSLLTQSRTLPHRVRKDGSGPSPTGPARKKTASPPQRREPGRRRGASRQTRPRRPSRPSYLDRRATAAKLARVARKFTQKGQQRCQACSPSASRSERGLPAPAWSRRCWTSPRHR
jgi:hypothetical protein